MKRLLISLCLLSLFIQPNFSLDISWRPLNEPGSGGRIVSLGISPHNPDLMLVGGDMLGVGISRNGGDSWQGCFGFDSWEMADISFHPTDPKIVWIGSMSGPYKSTDAGVNWTSKRKGMGAFAGYSYSTPVQIILFDPNHSQRLIAVGGSHRRWSSPGSPAWGAVWESKDGGENWQRISTVKGSNNQGANIVAAGFAAGSSDILYAAADGNGVFISEDGGLTWNPANSGLPHLNINWIEPHPTDPKTAWVALGNLRKPGDSNFTPGGIYMTSNYGVNWTAKNDGLPQNISSDGNQTARYEVVRVSKTNQEVLFTSNTSYSGSGLFLSKDGGVSWKKTANSVRTAYPAGKNMEIAVIDPNNENVILAAGSEYILRTVDGGDNWDDATAVYRAELKEWQGRGYSGLVCEGFAWDPLDPNHAAFCAMDAGNFWQSSNNLATWKRGGTNFPNWGGGNDMCFAGKQTMYVCCGQYNFEGIARTTDGGNRWTILLDSQYGLPPMYDSKKTTGIYALPDDSSKVWAAVGGDLYFSNDTGNRWAVIFTQAKVEKIAASKSDPLHFYLATNQGLYETRNGSQFEKIPGGPQPATGVFIDPNSDNVVYAVSWREQGGLWRFDGDWERIHNDNFIAAAAVQPGNSDVILFITNDHPYHDACYATGVYLTENGGKNWKQVNGGLPVLRGSCVTFNPHFPDQVVVGTGGRGYFVSGSVDTNVERTSNHLPKRFIVYPNYPNPFNPETHLSFEMLVAGMLNVRIYNILGRVVRMISTVDMPSGKHILKWDSTDDNGRPVAGGIYVVQFEIDGERKVQKILLVR